MRIGLQRPIIALSLLFVGVGAFAASPPDVDKYLRWLPADTEMVAVATGPFPIRERTDSPRTLGLDDVRNWTLSLMLSTALGPSLRSGPTPRISLRSSNGDRAVPRSRSR
jgi:hypothetical protein